MDARDLVQKICEHVSQPVLLIDRDYRIVWANRAARDHVDLPEAEVVRRSCFEVTHGTQEPCWRAENSACPVRDAFATRERARTIHRHWIADELIVEEIVATPLDDGNGEIEYVIEEFQNITALLELRHGQLPICASCKKIRNDHGSWLRIEEYIRDHTGADFSHSLCPDCLRDRDWD